MGRLLHHRLFTGVTIVRIQVLTNCKLLDKRSSKVPTEGGRVQFRESDAILRWILALRSFLHLGPGILQRDCAIEYERSGLGIGVDGEVSQAFELVTITGCCAK
jgi:hypothetical protein